MTFVQRKLGQTVWRRCRPDIVDPHKTDKDGRTPTHVGWDSHNYLTLALDFAGHLHASGNMHGHPLVYFRATRPGDVMSLEFFPHMVGDHEKHVSSPRFFTGPEGVLMFAYHEGAARHGRHICNRYNVQTQHWSRLSDEPAADKQVVTSDDPPLPAELMNVESSFPGMVVNTLHDGDYVLRWETLPPHRDKPLEGPPPPPSMLRVLKVS
jgi:hypothetical protein